MRDEDTALVRNLALFSGMAQESFDSLRQVSYLQTFPPAIQLITEGEPADFLHVVVEGCVELYAQSNGRQTTMALVRPVATFILAAVLNDAPYLMSARTTEKSRVLLIPAGIIRAAMEADAIFARAIVHELALRYRGVIKAHKNHKLRTGVERLANFLLRQHEAEGENGHLVLHHDKKTLASLLGMTPENLSRAFGTLKPYGVEVDGPEIRIGRVDDLRILAKPNPLIDHPDV